jgi:S-DNA-T family DNA segregation ATPase FtsK/SpoIIIE
MFNLSKIFGNLDTDTKLTLSIIACITTAILLYISILPFGNFTGSFGNVIGSFINLLLGKGAFLLPLGLLYTAGVLIQIQKDRKLIYDINARMIWGIVFMLLSFNGMLSLFTDTQNIQQAESAGGILGYLLYPWILGSLFGKVGTFFILIAFGLFGFFLLSNLTFVQFYENLLKTFKNPTHFLDFVPDVLEVWKQWKTKAQITQKSTTQSKSDSDDNDLTTINNKEKLKVTEQEVVEVKNQEIDPNKEDLTTPIIQNHWQVPPLDLLKEETNPIEPGDITKNKQIILETLNNFGINVEMGEVTVGPTVTQYTLKLAQGVRLSAVDNLQRDLALALAVNNLRIEAPIAGKSLVGIEIPNKKKSQVRLKQILQTKAFSDFKDPLPVVIGKDVTGNDIIYSLAKMPHLLVAGATGSGKSVWINSMLISLFYRYSPRDLQLILVDMKRVELKLYEGVPHLLCNVITDAEKAINALKWVLLEMENRYKLLEEFGKRNIADYNQFATKQRLTILPYLIFVIDELGDLMMLAKSEVEPIIVRLTQMSRAVGIHLVLGTQRPDTQVVTGLIKANVPSRIAFAVASQIDSRVILDKSGAEKLLGQGDGLFISPQNIQPVRFQGANVEEEEVKRCVTYLREQAVNKNWEANLKPEVTEPQKVNVVVPGMGTNVLDTTGDDEILEEAKKLVLKYRRASASFLQQMMGIGYPKAARIINELEAMGIIGPQNGSKPREVYDFLDKDN